MSAGFRHGGPMRWRRCALSIILTLATLFAALAQAMEAPSAGTDGDALHQVQARVVQAAVLRGHFEQEKQVEGFRNPLRSEGRFLVSREHGVLWITEKPFPSELVLTREHIGTRDAAGRLRIEVDTRRQPGLASINTALFALMAGDVTALARHFELEARLESDTDWQLRLVPRAGALQQAFRQIVLEGDTHVRRVRIDDRNGDQTLLRFSGLLDEPAQLDDEEAARFD